MGAASRMYTGLCTLGMYMYMYVTYKTHSYRPVASFYFQHNSIHVEYSHENTSFNSRHVIYTHVY